MAVIFVGNNTNKGETPAKANAHKISVHFAANFCNFPPLWVLSPTGFQEMMIDLNDHTIQPQPTGYHIVCQWFPKRLNIYGSAPIGVVTTGVRKMIINLGLD